jgi:aspartokinase
VLTDSTFTKARILKIDQGRIRKALADGNVVVVAGFQGADEETATSRRWAAADRTPRRSRWRRR